MKKIIFTTGLILAVFISNAQTSLAVSFGLQGSAVTPNFITYPDTVRKNITNKIGVSLGLTANVPIANNLFFRAGVLYAGKGSNAVQSYDTTGLYASTANLSGDSKFTPFYKETRLSVNYIDIPLNILYKYPLSTKKLLVGAGPQLSVFYNGHSSVNTTSIAQDSAFEGGVRYASKMIENNDLPVGKTSGKYRMLHFGWNALVGVEFNRVSISCNYTGDLNALYEEEGRKYKSKTFGILFSVFLGPRPKNIEKK